MKLSLSTRSGEIRSTRSAIQLLGLSLCLAPLAASAESSSNKDVQVTTTLATTSSDSSKATATTSKESDSSKSSGSDSSKSTSSDSSKSSSSDSSKSSGSDSSKSSGGDSSKNSGDSNEKNTSQAVASSVQSSARPNGLDITGKVMTGGSDDAAARFQKEVLPGVTDLVNTKLSESKPVNDASMLLDPSKLKLQTDSDVRVYFIGEGAGYHNTLGINTTGTGATKGDPKLIFPDASSSVSTYDPAQTAQRSSSAPLLPGDFVNLGKMSSGTLLNFFLIADGANGGKNVYSTDQSANPDGINHVVAFAYAIPGSSLLVIVFDDLKGGGDRDFNDVMFAVDVGTKNIAALTGTPEPTLAVSLGSLLVGTYWIQRRRTQAKVSTPVGPA